MGCGAAMASEHYWSITTLDPRGPHPDQGRVGPLLPGPCPPCAAPHPGRRARGQPSVTGALLGHLTAAQAPRDAPRSTSPAPHACGARSWWPRFCGPASSEESCADLAPGLRVEERSRSRAETAAWLPWCVGPVCAYILPLPGRDPRPRPDWHPLDMSAGACTTNRCASWTPSAASARGGGLWRAACRPPTPLSS